jgi:hypothetical protein
MPANRLTIFATLALAPFCASASSALSYEKLPLVFEQNAGQTDRRVDFLSRGPGYTLFLSSGEAVLRLNGSVVRMQMAGASRTASATGLELLPGKSNYLGSTGTYTGINQYGRLKYTDVYKGIDLVYYGRQRQLEYDFVVAPGADPSAIRIRFEGADRMEVDRSGDLVIGTAAGDLRFHRPVVYQEVAGNRREVAGDFRVDRSEVFFRIGDYRRDLPLVIDPVLSYSTYLGSIGTTPLNVPRIAADGSGNSYIAGTTDSALYPTTAGAKQTVKNGLQDIFVSKLNAAGTALVYSTFVGGTQNDHAFDIAVDPSGNAIVTGESNSTLTATAGAYQSCCGTDIAFKLNPSGSQFVYLTYTSGLRGVRVVAAPDGSAYIYGNADSFFTPTAGAYQGTLKGSGELGVLKLNAAGSGAVYATYVGGSGNEVATALAVDTAGNAYITGDSGSTNFPTTPGALLASGVGNTGGFASKLNATGSALVYSTMLRGTSPEDIAVGPSGDAFLTGTASGSFPATAGAYLTSPHNNFLLRLNPTGTALVYGTFLNNYAPSTALSVRVDPGNNALVLGTAPAAFPVVSTSDASQATSGGGLDVHISKFNSAGTALTYATFYGGAADESPSGVALDIAGGLHMTGTTRSANLPTTPGAYRSTATGTGIADLFAAKIGAAGASVFNLSVSGITPAYTGQSGTFTLTANIPNYAWTASSNQSWLQVFPLSGTGTAVVAYTVFPNYTTHSRTGIITVGAQTFTVTQAGSTGTPDERFVGQMYFNYFGRVPGADEVAFQAGALAQGVTTRPNLVLSFLNSAEFNAAGKFVAGVYVGLLNRTADYGGWLFQRNALIRRDTSPQSLVGNVIIGAEFQLQHPGMSDADFVRLLYSQILGRTATPTEVTNQVNNAIVGKPNGRRDLAVTFLNLEEFRNRSNAKLDAFLLYAVLLQRDASTTELNNRIAQLNSGTPIGSMVTDILNSPEFASLLQ